MGEHKCRCAGCTKSAKAERELIIELWYREMACHCEEPMQHLLSRIKGEN